MEKVGILQVASGYSVISRCEIYLEGIIVRY